MGITKHIRGFTLIEVVIVISVLGILLSIGIVGWGSVKTSSENKTRATELSQWKSTYELYKSRFAIFPSPSTNGTYCIGNDFPGGKCGVSGSFSQNTELIDQLKQVTRLPENPHPLVNGSYLGPYAQYGVDIRLIGVFKGNGGSTCPSGTTYDTASPSGVAYCYYSLPR